MERMIIVSVILISTATMVSILIGSLPAIIKALAEYRREHETPSTQNRVACIERKLSDMEKEKKYYLEYRTDILQRLAGVEKKLREHSSVMDVKTDSDKE